MPKTTIWIASFNQGKLREFDQLFTGLPVEFISAKEMDFYSSPKEDGDSFLENARIKAKSLKAFVGQEDWVLAEDSGLVVEALNGLPGIHSARYAGEKASDLQNNDKLLKMLDIKKASNRKAHYFCQIVLLSPEGKEYLSSGKFEGEIARKATGKGGFGYDPIFIPTGLNQSCAELSSTEKNKLSHRKQAVENLLSQLNFSKKIS